MQRDYETALFTQFQLDKEYEQVRTIVVGISVFVPSWYTCDVNMEMQ